MFTLFILFYFIFVSWKIKFINLLVPTNTKLELDNLTLNFARTKGRPSATNTTLRLSESLYKFQPLYLNLEALKQCFVVRVVPDSILIYVLSLESRNLGETKHVFRHFCCNSRWISNISECIVGRNAVDAKNILHADRAVSSSNSIFFVYTFFFILESISTLHRVEEFLRTSTIARTLEQT